MPATLKLLSSTFQGGLCVPTLKPTGPREEWHVWMKGGGRRLRSLRQQPKPTPRQHRLHKQANICCTQLSFIHSLNYRTQSASQKCIYFVVTVDLLYLHFFNRDYHGIVVVLYLFCFTNTWYV